MICDLLKYKLGMNQSRNSRFIKALKSLVIGQKQRSVIWFHVDSDELSQISKHYEALSLKSKGKSVIQ